MSKSNTMKKLGSILASKEEIKEATIAKGGSIDDSTPFAEYPDIIGNLTSSSEVDPTYKALIAGEELDLVIPNGVIKIGSRQFIFTKIKSVFIPASVVELDSNAFDSTSITRAEFHEDCTILSERMFQNCSVLSEVILPKKATSIPAGLFNNCTNLKYVFVPRNFTSIGYSAFNCASTESQAIIKMESETPPSIHQYAFTESRLKEIQVPMNAIEKYQTYGGWTLYANKIVGYEVV